MAGHVGGIEAEVPNEFCTRLALTAQQLAQGAATSDQHGLRWIWIQPLQPEPSVNMFSIVKQHMAPKGQEIR